jgi:hypothetical protein
MTTSTYLVAWTGLMLTLILVLEVLRWLRERRREEEVLRAALSQHFGQVPPDDLHEMISTACVNFEEWTGQHPTHVELPAHWKPFLPPKLTKVMGLEVQWGYELAISSEPMGKYIFGEEAHHERETDR